MYMNLFINAVSSQGKLILFDEARQITSEIDISLLLNESSKLIGTVDNFLTDNGVMYSDLENIVVIHGPGSFTGIRTIVLYVNTLSFTYKNIRLTPVSFFDMFDTYPIAKVSSKRDLFVKDQKSAIIEVVKNEDFVEKYTWQTIHGDIDMEGVSCTWEIDYNKFIQSISLGNEKKIEPLYIKKPNIS